MEPQPVAERGWRHDLAAAAGDVVSYHDDASLLARLIVLCKSYGVYALEAVKRGWQSVPAKSVLSGMWYGRRGMSEGEQQRSTDQCPLHTNGPRA